MAEFMFKSLSAKLLPADDVLRDDEGECQPCTDLCTAGHTDPCDGTSEPMCAVCSCAQHTDIPIISTPTTTPQVVDDVRSELARHKDYLRARLAAIARAERQPQSVAEVDELTAQLQAALAELAERRATLEAMDEGSEPT
jgi:hypothetical protein